jgi:DNA-binding beta-propeller fold protein YncE
VGGEFCAERLLLAIVFLLFVTSVLGQSSYVNFEGKQTQPIRLSPDGTRLFAVNTPDARLSVFDLTHPLSPVLIAEIPVGVEPVSVTPRNNDEVWVVNEVSDSISIVSVSQRMVTDTLAVKDEPADVVFAGGKAFVTASRKNEIHVFDVTNHSRLAVIPVFGENPRALVANTNGTKVYAAFALSGNRTTLVPVENAPPQPPPTNTNLPAPPQVALIVDATDPTWTNIIRYNMPDNDVVEIDVATMAVSRYFPRVGTVNLGIAIQSSSGDLLVANTDARNLTRFEPTVRGHIVENRVSRINLTNGAVTHFDLNPGVDYNVLPNASARSNALAQPTAIAFGGSGASFYVTAFGSDRIARVDANTGAILTRIELSPTASGSATDPRNKRGPRGLALKTGAAIYVLNRLANTISIIGLPANALVKEIPIGSYDPTPAAVRNGRGFLYDAKLSGNGTASCASCHVDAEMDLLAWDLGDPNGVMETNTISFPTPFGTLTSNSVFHPMKGPMTTQTLRGLNTLDPFHWRGDRTNFLHFNGAFDSLMGGTPLADADMAAYRAFINTVAFEPNPNQNLDRTLPTSFAGGNPVAGQNTFVNEQYQPLLGLSCNTCHALPTGSDRFINPGQVLQESQDFKVPQLRNNYQKLSLNRAAGTNSIGGFGFLHDGTFADVFTFLSQPVFGQFQNDTIRKRNLAAFLQCIDTGMAPAVGYTRTVIAANVNTASVSNDWSVLESQAASGTNIDLVVRGTIDGRAHGLLYQPASGTYRTDTTTLGALTRAQLVAKIQAGDTLSIMGVPPGSGARMGIDRDLDGVLDADVPPPQLQIAGDSGSNLTINWPFSAAGYQLESTTGLPPGSWTSVTNAIEIFAGRNYVTNPPTPGAGFYRLRFPLP